MNKTAKRLALGLIMVACSVGVMAFCSRPVSAAINSTTLNRIYSGLLWRCYNNGHINATIINDGQNIADNAFADLFTQSGITNRSVLLPDESGTVDDTITCQELVNGPTSGEIFSDDFSGLKNKYNIPSNTSSALQALGYEQVSGADNSTTCVSFGYDNIAKNRNDEIIGSNGQFTVANICFATEGRGDSAVIKNKNPSIALGDTAKQNGFSVSVDRGKILVEADTPAADRYLDVDFFSGDNPTIGAFKTNLNNTLGNGEMAEILYDYGRENGILTDWYMAFNSGYTTSNTTEGTKTGEYTWCNNNADCAANTANRNLFGSSNRALSDSEVAEVYLSYLKNYTVYDCPTSDVVKESYESNSYKKIRLKVNGSASTCYITSNTKDSFNGVDSNNVFGVKVGLDDIIAFFGSADESALPDLSTGTNLGENPSDPIINVVDNPDDATSNSGTENCYGAKGTLGLSWILCPTLTMLSTSLNNIYTDVAEQYLAVEPGLYSMTRTDESGNQVTNETYKAWSTFQTFANIILVIFLLVVIFSQLTGIGIDNYGIKKILPRLIVVAILINLSYLIAQFVIDVSNIVGSGISNILPHVDVSNIGPIESTSVPEKILGISLAGAGVAGVAALFANPALLLGLLLTLVSGLVSLLVMWLILIARKAGVVIAVVISPLAFAAYLLPNTSKLTKSWINLMKSLILVYPLAALLIGACFFASDLIQTTNSGLIMAAMLLRVVPFLALPTIFKKSLDAFGNLGTKIQGFGQTLSRGTTGAIRNADWYKNLQERGVERRTRMRAGLDQNGQEQTNPVFRSRLFRSYDDRTRARYRSQYLKTQADIDRASLLNDPQYMEEMRFKQDLALEGERNEIELMNDPNYRESLRANQQEALEKKQKDVQSSMLKTGKFTYTDTSGAEHTIADPSNGGALRDALVAELSKSDGDISKINALYDAIRAKGDAGIDLLGEVWDSGTLDTAGRGFAEFRDKIVADGEIKSKARTLHSVAKNVQNGSLSYSSAGNQVADARSNGVYVKDIAAEKIPDLTSNEMAALNTRAQGGDAVAQETIYRALANPDINSKIKGNDRDSVLLSGAYYLQNNYDQIDHSDDQLEIWKDANGNEWEIGVTKEGIRYNADTNPNHDHNIKYRAINGRDREWGAAIPTADLNGYKKA